EGGGGGQEAGWQGRGGRRVRSQGFLKDQLQPKLNDARGAGAGGNPKVTTAQVTIRHVPVRMIEGIKELAAELQPHLLPNVDVLIDRQIDKVRSRTDHR